MPSQQFEKLDTFISQGSKNKLPPLLWVGAGASAASGYPTLNTVEASLRKDLPGCTATGGDLIDVYEAEFSRAALSNALETLLGGTGKPVHLHEAFAKLAGKGLLKAIFTTNYDELIEDALKAQRVSYVPQVLELNFQLSGRQGLHVLKLHGSRTDWKSVILSKQSYRDFESSYPLLTEQLEINLLTHSLLFVGCSMRDPRLLGWLEKLGEKKRGDLHGGRVLITEKDWKELSSNEVALLASANIKPILVKGHSDISDLLVELAKKYVTPELTELVFELEPDKDTWRVQGPADAAPVHEGPNPLAEPAFISQLVAFREMASLRLIDGTPEALRDEAVLKGLANSIGERLTGVLLSPTAREAVRAHIARKELGRARLTLRVRPGELSDQALALPWELLTPAPGRFAVEWMELDLVRDATGGKEASILDEPTAPLSLSVTISAPDDQTTLHYEDEAFRLYQSLAPLGHSVAFTDLGTVDDMVSTAAEVSAAAIHFSGHGLPGALVFEDDFGLSDKLSVEALVKKLNEKLSPSSSPSRFPKLFFLASCHGASGVLTGPGDEADGHGSEDHRQSRALERALGHGPSTAATLHRNGFVQVVGYFGPVSDPLCTRAEEVFYGAVADGKTTLQATAEARASLAKPLAVNGRSVWFPFSWAQFALYHRGPDRALARAGKRSPGVGPERYGRKEKRIEVSGLPALEFGFIGRRSRLHELRRKVREGQRLLVLQGLGGLGKTALASHLLRNVFTQHEHDALVLVCQGLDPAAGNVIDNLWEQVEKHGAFVGIEGWAEQVKAIRERKVEAATGFEETVKLLRKARPGLVLYADNVETLQVGPEGEEPAALGAWHPEALAWWESLQRLAGEGLLVMVTTRFLWKELDPKAWIGITPMGPADILRMIESFAELGRLPHDVRSRLASRVEGHPRAVEYLDKLVGQRVQELGVGAEVGDFWAEVVEPVLPKGEEQLTANLLLARLWERLSGPAKEHARSLSVLRVPAPMAVIHELGSTTQTQELIRAGVLTRFPEQSQGKKGHEWVERWGMHSLVTRFVSKQHVDETTQRSAHFAAGRAYAKWVEKPGARRSEQREGIFHFHAVKAGDEAWPMVEQFVVWLRQVARYREAVSMLELCEAAETTGENLASALMLLCQMQRQLGTTGEDVWNVLERALGFATSEKQRASVLHEQGEMRKAQGKYPEAEHLLRQSLFLKEKAFGVAHPSYGASLHALASVLRSQGEYPEAESLLRQSLSLVENTLGVAHPDYGASLHGLAVVLMSQRKYQEAETLLHRSLSLLEKVLDVDHPDYGTLLSNLGLAIERQGRPLEAEPYAKHAVDIVRRLYGPHHPSTVQVQAILARVQAAAGSHAAQNTASEALEGLEHVFSFDHPIRQELAPVLKAISQPGAVAGMDPRALFQEGAGALRANDFPRAVKVLAPLAEQAHQEDLPGLEASACGLLAQALFALGQKDEARAQARRALELAEQLKEPDAVTHFRALLQRFEP